MPSAAGFGPSIFQGGNCLGRVRTSGHLPARALDVAAEAAWRSFLRVSPVKALGTRTKPSRLRRSRSVGLVIVFVVGRRRLCVSELSSV